MRICTSRFGGMRSPRTRGTGVDLVVGENDRLAHPLLRRKREAREHAALKAAPELQVLLARERAQDAAPLLGDPRRDPVRKRGGIGPLAGRERITRAVTRAARIGAIGETQEKLPAFWFAARP